MADGSSETSNNLDVHIVTPEREVWAGSASFLLARSAGGDMGVLPGHEPTLSILGAGPLRIEGTEAHEWGVDGGFLSIGRTGGGVTRVDVLAERVTDFAEQVVPRSVATAPSSDEDSVEH